MGFGNKWSRHGVMSSSTELSAYMPETRKMSQGNLTSMLNKYGMVYVKPVNGSMGVGVMRVEKRGKGIRCQAGTVRRSFPDVASGYEAIRDFAGGKAYMVQMGIRLKKYRGRPFDLRIMVQRKPGGPWKVTGIAGRLAHPRKIVTNGSQGGTIYPASVLLPGSEALINRMKGISLRTVRRLHAVYPGLKQIGLDMAVDTQGRPWIIEANTKPDPCPFTKLPSHAALREIVSHGKAWGIHYKLKCLKSHRGR
ncbi:YheC/YheD family protein [Cohnella candidum]|uniref:YheC/YheD family protein n=1 Tax=Cohnella candidum TaxID=2674991 RepID=A0A3G3K3F4_9BACL|nr:YheC/YheD family protein [Cohnella candidum]AYQ75013.1 YheC/YheD family protein [Cohnella candidum]